MLGLSQRRVGERSGSIEELKLTDLEDALDVVRRTYQGESDAAQASSDRAVKPLFITSLAVRPSRPSWKADRVQRTVSPTGDEHGNQPH
jgi:hypothetical protein